MTQGAKVARKGGPRVSQHAIDRYRERVADVTEEAARQALSSVTIAAAIAFGAHFVRLGTGQRVVIEGDRIITVLPAGTGLRQFAMANDARHLR